MLYFLIEHTLVIYLGTKKRKSSLQKIKFEIDFKGFVSANNMNALNVTIHFQSCFKPKNIVVIYFLGDCVFSEIRLTHVNKLLHNMIRNEYVMAYLNLCK